MSLAALLKEVSQLQTSRALLSYNDEAVRNSISEVKNTFAIATAIAKSDEYAKDPSLMAKVFMLKLQLKRARRILTTYHIHRLLRLAKNVTEFGEFATNVDQLASKAELKFYRVQSENVAAFKSVVGPHITLCGPLKPPKDFYIQVRVNVDCGVIQTEFGKLSLRQGTFHYLKRSDVEHLIMQGFLNHVI